jgi:putative peptidoglycan lipid II flippase
MPAVRMRLNAWLGILAAMQLLLVLAAQLIILRSTGIGTTTDAFIASQLVPLLVNSVLGIALSHVWQPRLAVCAESERRELAGSMLAQALILFSGVTIVLLAAAGPLSRILFPGFGSDQAVLTAELSQILLLGVPLNGVTVALTALARAENRFRVAEIASLVSAAVMVCSLPLVLPKFGIHGAAVILLCRSAWTTGQLWLSHGLVRPSLARAEDRRAAMAQLRPLMFGASIYKMGPMVDRYWASLGPAGGLSAFNLITTAMGALATIMDRSLATPVLPVLARLYADGDLEALKSRLRATHLGIWSCTLAIGLVLFLAWPIWTQVLWALLLVPPEVARQIYWVGVALLPFLGCTASGTVIVACFYASGDTRTTPRLLSAGFFVGLALKSAGFLLAGLIGLAIAVSATFLLNTLVMHVLLLRRLAPRADIEA